MSVVFSAGDSIRGYRLGRAEIVLSLLVAGCAFVAGRVAPLWAGHVTWACPLLTIAGVPCPSCGGTRAVAALAAGHLGEALAWNPLVALGGIGAALWIPAAVLMLLGAVAPPVVPTTLRPATRWALPLLIVANWVYLLFWFRG